MKQIYSKSYLTISATYASSGGDGCFTKTRRMANIGKTQAAYDHRAFSFTQDYGHRCPLLLRAWANQERLLSTRVLHFGPDEMIWECQTDFWCECQENRDAFRFRNKQQSCSDHTRSWQAFAISYTVCSLTHDADRITAFAGVAEYLSTANDGILGGYYAGLWQTHLMIPAWLCWYVPAAGHRPGIYVAPSWSWASVKDCTVQVPLADKILHTHATVIWLDCTLSTPSPYGAVSAGYMVLEGELVPFPCTLTERYEFFADAQDDGGVEDGETLYCIPIYESGGGEKREESLTKHLTLCSTERPSTFRRVGVLVDRVFMARCGPARLQTIRIE
jgi:hypothetical protein